MAWLSQRYDVFMIHLQGSAQLEFTDGTVQSVGFAAGTDYPFRGISQNFLDHHQVAWQNLPSFFERRPQLLDEVLSRNNRFIFFKRYGGGQPLGSIGVPVIPERSIATDKDCLPPGAIGLINASLPQRAESGSLVLRPTMRIVLDQDTGSAIRGPGRVDIFMGSGEEARKMANMVYTSGSLYYLLLKA
jgi:membrane-bound lytic murein transglycosylase A